MTSIARHARYLISLVLLAQYSVLARPALPFQASTDSSGHNSSIAGPCAVTGAVVDSLTGAPLRRALVVLRTDDESYALLTDESGKFRFERLPAGQGSLSAQKPGFSERGETTPVTITADTSSVVLKLEPRSGITVRVINEDGEGLEDLPVRVLGSQVWFGRRTWVPYGGGQTNEQGEVQLRDLSPGKYYVAVGPAYRPVGQSGDTARTDLGYPRVFYSNALELDGAAPVEVTAGRRAHLEITLATERMYRVSGKIVGAAAGQGCRLRFTDRSGEEVPIGSGLDPVTGVFQSGEVPSGYYVLVVACALDGESALGGRLPLTVNSNLTNVTIPVVPFASISVNTKTDAEGSNDEDVIAVVGLTSKHPGFTGIGGLPELESEGGRRQVVLKHVEPGIYSVDIHPTPGWYVDAAHYGSVNLLTQDLSIAEGEASDEIEITLRKDGAKISGNVRGSARNSSAATVLLVPGRTPQIVTQVHAVDGSYSFRDIAPGAYRVLALDRADDLEYRNPDVMRDYLTKAQSITLSAKQEVRMDLDIVPREK